MSEEKEELKEVYPSFRYKAAEEKKDAGPKDRHAKHLDPHMRYHAKVVHSKADDAALAKEGGWVASPADLGIETHPSHFPDESILAKAGGKSAKAEEKLAPKKLKGE